MFRLVFLLAVALAPSGNAVKNARDPCSGKRWGGGCSVGGGRYTVTRKLGEGAFGQVWSGTATADKSPVAIKFIDTIRNADVLPERWPEHLRGFRTEIELMRSLSHPHVLRLSESFEENNFIHVVTDLARGDLDSNLTASGYFRVSPVHEFSVIGVPAPEALVRRLLHEAGSGLAYVHAHGIVHRDIKPDNILIGRDESAPFILADLGISEISSSYIAELERAVPAGAERNLRMDNELYDKDGIVDGDGDGVGDAECMEVAAGAAAASRCRRHLRVEGAAGTYPFMSPESRDRMFRLTKINQYYAALTRLVESSADAELQDEVDRVEAAWEAKFATEAIDVYSLGLTAYAMMRGESIGITGVQFSTDDLAEELSNSSYSPALQEVVVSMLDPNPASRASLGSVFSRLGVKEIPGSTAPSLLHAPPGTCEKHRDCDDCTPFPNCAWCSSSRSCVPFAGSCPVVHNRSKILLPSGCSVARRDMVCEEINTCGLCASQSTCAWCPGGGAPNGGTCSYHSYSCPAGSGDKVLFKSRCPVQPAAPPSPAANAEAKAAASPSPISCAKEYARPSNNREALANCQQCASQPSCSFCGDSIYGGGSCAQFGSLKDRSCSSFRSMTNLQCVGYAYSVVPSVSRTECEGPLYGSKEKCSTTWTCNWCEPLGQCQTKGRGASCPNH